MAKQEMALGEDRSGADADVGGGCMMEVKGEVVGVCTGEFNRVAEENRVCIKTSKRLSKQNSNMQTKLDQFEESSEPIESQNLQEVVEKQNDEIKSLKSALEASNTK